jgi:hypothetical protein
MAARVSSRDEESAGRPESGRSLRARLVRLGPFDPGDADSGEEPNTERRSAEERITEKREAGEREIGLTTYCCGRKMIQEVRCDVSQQCFRLTLPKGCPSDVPYHPKARRPAERTRPARLETKGISHPARPVRKGHTATHVWHIDPSGGHIAGKEDTLLRVLEVVDRLRPR